MILSYKNVYVTERRENHCTYFEYTGTPFFETNGTYIFNGGLIFALYFAFCIFNGIKMIEREQNCKTLKILDFKIVEFRKFLSIITLEFGGLIIGTLSILLGTFLLCSLIATIESFGPFKDYYIVISMLIYKKLK